MTNASAAPAVPRVSIGVPVFNGAATLASALDCLIGQTEHNIEIIISDNASTDATEAVCRDYVARDPRIRYFRQPKTVNATNNFKFVLAKARAPYFMWAAHDDTRDADFVERLLAALEKRPDAVLAFGDIVRIVRGQPSAHPLDFVNTGKAPWRRLHWSAVSELHHLYGLWRTEVPRRIRWEHCYWWHDTPLMMAAALAGDFVHVPGVHFRYQVNPRPFFGWKRRPGPAGVWLDIREFLMRAGSVAYLIPLTALTVGRSAGAGYGLLAGLFALIKVVEQVAGYLWRRAWRGADASAERA